MSLDATVEKEAKGMREVKGKRDYLPFGRDYLEAPAPRGDEGKKFYAWTSVTFCTFKWVPLVDDGD